jgi:Mg2+ and Co2+ transporter CorA
VALEDWLVPIAGMLMVVAIVGLSLYFRAQRAKYAGGGDYQRLADEAVRGQRLLLDEVQRMNQTLKEIERLLREV